MEHRPAAEAFGAETEPKRQPWKWATLIAAMAVAIGALSVVVWHEVIPRGQSTKVEARNAFQKGWEHYSRFTPEDNAKAAELFKKAVELDPEYGRAYSALSMAYGLGIPSCGWRWQEALGINTFQAKEMSLRYLAEGEQRASTLTHLAASQIYLYKERHDKAFTEAARAIALDPSDPEAQVAMALAMITTGRPEVGLEYVQSALQLNPSYPTHYVVAVAMAYFTMNNLEKTAAVLKKGLDRDPRAVELAPFLAATYARLDHREEAQAVLQQWQPDNHGTSLERIVLGYHLPYSWAHDEKEFETRLRDGLHVAAMPLDMTIEDLIETLRDEDADARRRAAMTLGWFGPNAADAVPALIDALVDEEQVVERAVVALGKIGPAAAAAIPDLTALTNTRYAGFEAKAALKKIAGQ